MARLVAAFDKFRGSATAVEVAAAAARGARASGWNAEELPLADGGEGTLDVLARALGGERRHATVRGPLGDPVDAAWQLVPGGLSDGRPEVARLLAAVGAPAGGPVAVVESALAVGRGLLPSPRGDDPLRARTEGVGDLVLTAIEAGARLVVVGAGGSATTDGGWGAVSALGSTRRLRDVSLVVACDVTIPFRSAAEMFAPQKGASPAQVSALRARLDQLAARYRDELGVDVDRLPGAGAAGGLAGGLAAFGARLVGGFELVAALVELDRHVANADLVVTGEGRLDATSFAGKVVGGILRAAGGRPPALCVGGQIEPGVERFWADRPGPVKAVSLVSTVGNARTRRSVAAAVSDVVATACRNWNADGAPLASTR